MQVSKHRLSRYAVTSSLQSELQAEALKVNSNEISWNQLRVRELGHHSQGRGDKKLGVGEGRSAQSW